MPINLNNINISLNEFQRLSKGEYNAGEVKLAGESRLTKMNNHVHQTGKNNEVISHAEVLAIKEALVKALSDNGVGRDEINRIRKELGLAPDGEGDRTLRTRSLKPLSRQQIREILDRNAATVNNYNAEHQGRVHIRTSAELYGPEGMSQDAIEKRDAVNTRLADDNRMVERNKDVVVFQMVVADGVDFYDYETREAMLKEAKAQLDALLVACQGNPRENVEATATFRLPTGQTITSPTGKSEAAFMRQLENQIVRLQKQTPTAVRDVRAEFRACKTPEAKQAFFAALPEDPRGGFKARTVAVMLLHSRGVVDFAKLNLVNRLSDADAIVLAQHLASLPDNVRGGELASNPLLVAMGAKPPKEVRKPDCTYVPATSAQDYNNYVEESFINDPEKGLLRFKLLAQQTADAVRSCLGAKGFPDNAKLGYLVDSGELRDIIDCGENAERVTPDTLREPFLRLALKHGAERMVNGLIREEIAAAGLDPFDVEVDVRLYTARRNPELVQRLASAQSPAEAEGILAEFREPIRNAIRLNAELNESRAGVEDRARAALAEKFGVSPQTIADAKVELSYLKLKANELLRDIGCGRTNHANRADYQKAFNDLVDKFVRERIDLLDATDALELPGETKDSIKQALLRTAKVKDVNLGFLAAETEKLDTAHLEQLLRSGAPKEQIFDAMKPIATAVRNSVNAMLAGKDEVGPDDREMPTVVMMRMLVGKRPALAELLGEFYAKPDVRQALRNRSGVDKKDPAMNSVAFEYAQKDPQLNRFAEGERLVHEKLIAPGQNAAKIKAAADALGEDGAAFLAAGGAKRAASAGYHHSETAMLVKAFALHKAATGCSNEVALEAALDHQGKTRRLVAYGGRFTESVENFRAGLALLDKFAAWYANLAADFAANKFDTITKSNAASTFVYAKAVRGYEMFIFQDLAINTADLNEQDPEKLFGVANNDAMNFFVRGNGSGCTGTLVALPPAKRQVVYAAFRVLEPHVTELGKHSTDIPDNENVLARILRHFDEVADLVKSGQLTRARLNQILTPDLNLPSDATPRQVKEAIENRYFERYGNSQAKLMEVFVLLTTTGCTVTELMTAMEGGERPAPLPEISSTTMSLEEIDGTTSSGRKYMLGDLKRPQNPTYIANGQLVLSEEDNHFTVKIGGETIPCAKGAQNEINAHIADKIEALCGKVHVEQASTVMRGLSQGAHGPFMQILPEHGIVKNIGSEHTPLTYTLSKNDETGAVTIRYSEPEGFPFKFHWETTVALDGTSTTTPVVIDA